MGGVQLYDEPQPPHRARHAGVYAGHTTNPGGVGHGWVKERFITPAAPAPPFGRNTKCGCPTARPAPTGGQGCSSLPASLTTPPCCKTTRTTWQTSRLCPRRKSRPCCTAAGTAFRARCSPSGATTPNTTYRDQRWTHVVEPFAHTQALADLAGIRLRVFAALLGGVVRGGRGRAHLPDQGAVRVQRPAQRGPTAGPGGTGPAHPGGRAERPGAAGDG